MFGRAVVPVSARGRIVQLAMGGPVEVAGVIVEQGDYVLADRNGVVFVPAGDLERVLGLAEREDAIVADVLSGTTLAEARRRHGYHLLQRREVQP